MTDRDATARHAGRASVTTLLLLMLGADVAFLILHVRASLPAAPDRLFLLDTDGGYAEVFQYVKECGTAILLGLVYRRTRQGVLAVWTALFAYILLDDALRIHEQAGETIGWAWGALPTLGLQPQVFGELTFNGIIGAGLLAPLACFHRCAQGDARRASRALALLLGALVFFGVLVDALHGVLDGLRVPGLTIVEEWGEMTAMSVIACYARALVGQPTCVGRGP